MYHEADRKYYLIVFILCCIVHLGVFIPLFMLESDREFSLPLPMLHEKLDNQSIPAEENHEPEWASRKPAANQFGAPVLFEQEPAEQNQTHEEEDQIENTISQSTVEPENQEKQPTEDSQEISDGLTESKQKPEQLKELGSTEKSYITDKTETTLLPSQEKSKNSAPKPQQILRPQPHQQASPKSIPTKKPFTLANLAQGFLHYAKNEGNDTVEIDGNDTIRPTDEQIKHERYWQKIAWQIQNSSRINSHVWTNIPQNTQAAAQFHMTLNKDGSIQQLAILKPSGMTEFDRALLRIIQDASTAFPPVPTYFSGDHYAMRFTLYLEPPQGGSYRFRVQ